MRGSRLSVPSATISSLFDAGASDARLEHLARLTAAKFWFQQEEDDIGRRWTFLMRGKGKFIYAVVPIFRGRYWAVVRAAGADVVAAERRQLEAEDMEVRSISVLEEDAMKLACAEVKESP